MDASQIIAEKLRELGADGLRDPDSKCGCPRTDLMCCGACDGRCVPARWNHSNERFEPLDNQE